MKIKQLGAVLEGLFDKTAASVMIDYNDHHLDYCVASEVSVFRIKSNSSEAVWFSDDDCKHAIETDSVWRIRFSKDDGGTDMYYASTLYNVIMAAVKGKSKELMSGCSSEEVCEIELRLKALLTPGREYTSIAIMYEETDKGMDPPAESTAQFLEIIGYDQDDFVTPEEYEKVLQQKSYWIVYWFPDTPVGHYQAMGSSLSAVLEDVLSD